jgi:hypothetical protein
MSRDGTSNQIAYIQIDSDGNYFNTDEQISKIESAFADASAPSILTSSSTVVGLFSGRRIIPDPVYNSATYPTSSTVVDESGNQRAILALNVDYYASSTIDIYKQGVEIRDQKHWTAGLVKISAGTPGHLYQSMKYGVNEVSIVHPDKYFELEPFNPVVFASTGGDPSSYTFPVITSEVNQLENGIINGTIEPFSIRPVISSLTINFPFEPNSFKADFGNGNINRRLSSDQVVSLDYRNTNRRNSQVFLDATELLAISSGSIQVGVHAGEYLILDENTIEYFEDAVPPRGYINSASYPEDLLNVVYSMSPGGTTHVTNKQKSATCGFVYDDVATQGTDSIAFGGMLY